MMFAVLENYTSYTLLRHSILACCAYAPSLMSICVKCWWIVIMECNIEFPYEIG